LTKKRRKKYIKTFRVKASSLSDKLMLFRMLNGKQNILIHHMVKRLINILANRIFRLLRKNSLSRIQYKPSKNKKESLEIKIFKITLNEFLFFRKLFYKSADIKLHLKNHSTWESFNNIIVGIDNYNFKISFNDLRTTDHHIILSR
jgi:hypothetical protein